MKILYKPSNEIVDVTGFTINGGIVNLKDCEFIDVPGVSVNELFKIVQDYSTLNTKQKERVRSYIKDFVDDNNMENINEEHRNKKKL